MQNRFSECTLMAEFEIFLHMYTAKLKIRGSKGYFSIEFWKISIEIETEGVKMLRQILDFSIEFIIKG